MKAPLKRDTEKYLNEENREDSLKGRKVVDLK